MKYLIHANINITVNNNYGAQSDNSNKGGTHDEHHKGHIIKFEELSLKKIPERLDGYNFEFVIVQDNSDNKYNVLDISPLAKEIVPSKYTSLKVNKLKIPVYKKEVDNSNRKWNEIEILVQSDPIYEKEDIDNPTKITSGGCIWEVFYTKLRNEIVLLEYPKDSIELGVKYEYAIPFPAVTHFNESAAKGTELIPQLVVFPSNDPNDREILKKHLKSNSKIVIGFYEKDHHPYTNGDGLTVNIVKELHIFRNAHSKEILDSLIYK